MFFLHPGDILNFTPGQGNQFGRILQKEETIMPLTHTRDLFAKALKGKYALGAFNVNNMELLQAIIEACEEEKAPVMLQISKGARSYFDLAAEFLARQQNGKPAAVVGAS